MPQIPTFAATCATCGSRFGHPDLGDFAYGEFILTGESGNGHAYLNAIGNPVVEFVAGMIEDASIIQEVTARLADPVDGQRFTMSHVCPTCRSHEWESWHGERLASEDVAEALFSEFLSLSLDDRKRRILEVLRELRTP
jgi:hypothetical protein